MLRGKCLRSSSGSSYGPATLHARYLHSNQSSENQLVNHYEALGLEPNASLGEIKKQFYNLSKTHHPDHNPDDPNAAERFMKLSEAYAILGTPQKRERYDRDFLKSQNPSPRASQGSYSSAASPYGARPASGLSRRRTQFRGPPPSFYRSGGWGSHWEKRQAQAEDTAQAHAQSAATSSAGGMGPGQGQAGFSNDVPHFDQRAHLRTQRQQEQRRQKRERGDSVAFEGRENIIIRFLVISGVVVLACWPFVQLRRPDAVITQSTKKEHN